MRDHCVGRAVQADEAGERAGIHARQPDLAFVLQPGVEIDFGAEIARPRRHFAHHAAQRAFHLALDIFGVRADIADMREGEGDDLPGIAGVGHHFLITGHRGVEAHLPHSRAFRPAANAPQGGAIGKKQQARRTIRLRRSNLG